MSVKQFKLPDPGEGLLEAEIVTWKVKAGEQVKVNDIIVEIETAKSLVELPVPWNGTVAELLVAEGATVDVGTPIIAIEVAGEPDGNAGGDAGSSAVGAASGTDQGESAQGPNLVGYGTRPGSSRRRAPAQAPGEPAPAPAAPAPTPTPVEPAAAEPEPPRAPERPLAKPPVRKFAKDRGVDLSAVGASAASGIISRADVEAYLSQPPAADEQRASEPGFVQATRSGERETRIPIRGVRKVTAQAMVGSAFTAPHVTEFVTVDVTRTMKLVDRLRQDRDFAGVKVSPLLVVARALCLAVRRNPGINATWDDAAGEIVVKNYVNLGIAAATPRGLIVPNIKDADQMSMLQLAQAMGSLVDTAREGRTSPADQGGGSITITNVGVFGVDNGTPIINPGEAAILCFGAVRRMPWVVQSRKGERIKPRWVTQLSVAFDHRLVDGDLGSRFLADVAAVLHDPDRALVWA